MNGKPRGRGLVWTKEDGWIPKNGSHQPNKRKRKRKLRKNRGISAAERKQRLGSK